MPRIIDLWVHPLRPVIREIGDGEGDIGGRGWGRWMDRERGMFLSHSFCQKICLFMCVQHCQHFMARKIYSSFKMHQPQRILLGPWALC